ncbi:voltage-dependent anion-selective channel-like isoform X1 [Tribolium madens]|uniref:voltage-dependent anion-selective channel-like isoform X1 n=2 Tax=Tribolium madens TaxID=41895 RepID=UPI001CF73089|nr:voltage-dependent anion-selective channel-like isoform X1 [Tribolium madens]
MENPLTKSEEKKFGYPKVRDSDVKNEKPKVEVRRLQYDPNSKGADWKKQCSPSCCPSMSDSQRLIMAPPPYSDLGKKAKDVFGKGYHFGLIKLDCKTKTGSGVEFNTGGVSNQESGKVFGSLETKYKVKEYGLTFSEKWNTDNTLATEVAIQDQLLKGLKLSSDLTFSPQTGSKSARVKTAFTNERVALNCDVDLDSSGPLIQAAAVVGHQGWLAGYQTAFDTQKSKLTKNNFALGFSTGDFILHTNVDHSDDGQEFGGSIYQKLSPKMETGIQLAWSAGSNNTKFGIGAKYDLDQDAAIRAKVNNSSQIGLGYQQRLREGVTLTLSALIDGKNFNNGGHKIGLAVELEA